MKVNRDTLASFCKAMYQLLKAEAGQYVKAQIAITSCQVRCLKEFKSPAFWASWHFSEDIF